MSEATLAAEAEPIVEAVAKELTPELKQFLANAKDHILAEAERLKGEIDAHHNGLIEFLENTAHSIASANPAAAPDPTPARPAAPAA